MATAVRERVAALKGFITGMFPAWLLGCVYWAWARPAAFASFHPAHSGNAVLTLTMLGVGLNLSPEVRCIGTIALAFEPVCGRCTGAATATAPTRLLHIIVQDFRRVQAAPARIVDSLVLQYLIPPALALLVSRLFCLPRHYAVG